MMVLGTWGWVKLALGVSGRLWNGVSIVPMEMVYAKEGRESSLYVIKYL
jgi:hypothetical protein